MSSGLLAVMTLEQKQRQEATHEILFAERAYVRDLRLINRVNLVNQPIQD